MNVTIILNNEQHYLTFYILPDILFFWIYKTVDCFTTFEFNLSEVWMNFHEIDSSEIWVNLVLYFKNRTIILSETLNNNTRVDMHCK